MATAFDSLQIVLPKILQTAAEDKRIPEKIKQEFSDKAQQQQVAQSIVQFLNYFDMFKGLKPLSKELSQIIMETFEICEIASEFHEILLKSILLRFTEIYIDHAGYADKDKIIKTLSQSLEILAPQALIINLGLMVKPIFANTEYLKEQEKTEEKVVEKVDNSTIALRIKNQIDNWIRSQRLDVDAQAELGHKLNEKVEQMAKEAGLPTDSQEFKLISLECSEMLNLQLTAISLMLDLDDEDLSPQPITL